MKWIAVPLFALGCGAGAASPLVVDDFERADRLIHGDTTQSGHRYRGNIADGHGIRNGRYMNFQTATELPAAYLDLPNPPSSISVEFRFTPGEEINQVGIIGATSSSLEAGAIKLLIYRNQWRLIASQNPPVLPAPILAAGMFEPVLETGKTYSAILRRDGEDTATVEAPDGTIRTVKHPFIRDYWGATIGLQTVRQTRKSGSFHFESFAAE